jgi:hypothetical protein
MTLNATRGFLISQQGLAQKQFLEQKMLQAKGEVLRWCHFSMLQLFI